MTRTLGMLAGLMAAIQVGCSGTGDGYESGDGPLGESEAPVTVQIAGSGAATGRLMQGFKCNDTAGIACDTGTTCAPTKAVCLPFGSLVVLCSNDTTIRAALTEAASDFRRAVSSQYSILVDSGHCSSADNVEFANVSPAGGSFPSNDIRAYTRMTCAASTPLGTATVPFSGSSSPTYTLRACDQALVSLDLTAMNNRGATATEDANFLKYAVRHYLAAYMGAGSHSFAYNTTASYNIFGALSFVPAFLSSGEACRIAHASGLGTAVLSTSANCANN
jgi:hypothetical protein